MMLRMLGLRLLWYKNATAQLLMRRWQTILLAVGTMAPVGGSLLGVAAYPVLALLAPEHGVAWRVGAIGLWQGCWALWAMMQRDQLHGGVFTDYARALPIGRRTWRAVDLVVLFLADTPLLIPFVAALIAVLFKHAMPWEVIKGTMLIAFLLVTQLCAQIAILQNRPQVVPSFLAINLWVAIALALPPLCAALGVTIALGASLVALVADVPAMPRRANDALRGLLLPLGRRLSWLFQQLPPHVRLSLAILYRQHYSIMLGKFFTCMLVLFTCLGLMSVWQYDYRCLPTAVIASTLIALASSGLYRPLEMAHEAARSLSGALPLRARWSVAPDTVAILSFGLPFVLALVWTLHSRVGLPALSALVYVASFMLLSTVLRWPQLFSSRHAVVSSSLLAVLWTVGTANIFPILKIS
ncbi:hypothetical protein [Massilia sp. TWP1-3-3]|uniref:hypothetical protein n=1 Tax=Massilia sp. TWP1-3-3 TaxID=2804573 RepID=UPI003CE8D8A1